MKSSSTSVIYAALVMATWSEKYQTQAEGPFFFFKVSCYKSSHSWYIQIQVSTQAYLFFCIILFKFQDFSLSKVWISPNFFVWVAGNWVSLFRLKLSAIWIFIFWFEVVGACCFGIDLFEDLKILFIYSVEAVLYLCFLR